jgi:hypothetical protein
MGSCQASAAAGASADHATVLGSWPGNVWVACSRLPLLDCMTCCTGSHTPTKSSGVRKSSIVSTGVGNGANVYACCGSCCVEVVQAGVAAMQPTLDQCHLHKQSSMLLDV